MEAKDVTRLPWKKVTDWSELSTSEEGFFRRNLFVTATDISIFVENVFRDVSRQLNIPYEQLEPVLIAENNAFFKLKKRLFSDCFGYCKWNYQLIDLENTLRIPDISKIGNVVAEDKVSLCFKMFEDLSAIEKMVFLQKIGKINVKI